MRGLIIRWVTTAFALWLTSLIVKGIDFSAIAPLFVAAVVLGIFNTILRPLVLVVTFPVDGVRRHRGIVGFCPSFSLAVRLTSQR